MKVARKKQLSDPQIYADDCYWFMDYQNIVDAFNNTIPLDILEEAIANTVKIADSVDAKIEQSIYLPQFGEENTTRILTEKCFKRLEEISHRITDPALYTSRLLYEIDTIEKLGFVDYFLMVEDFLNYARSKFIPVGPGRGSVGGSLVAYLLKIVVADPIKYDLLFERFLSIHRPGLPDCKKEKTLVLL